MSVRTSPIEAREFSRSVGERIRKMREEKKMSQWALSLRAGIQVVQVSRVEIGESSPTLERLYVIARALDTTPEALLSELVK